MRNNIARANGFERLELCNFRALICASLQQFHARNIKFFYLVAAGVHFGGLHQIEKTQNSDHKGHAKKQEKLPDLERERELAAGPERPMEL